VRKLWILLAATLIVSVAWAQNNKSNNGNESNVHARLNKSANILENMTNTAPDKGIPQSVIDNAKCVAVIPHMIKGAFIVGGEHGSGFATCRTSSGWSAPAPFSVTGISWGPQIGGQSTNLIMMVMNNEGMKDLISGHFKVGGDVSAAAGPVGRQASASAGWKAGILTYSQSKGAFVGASISGAEIQQDNSATKELYGRDVSFKSILKGSTKAPTVASRFERAVANANQRAAK